METSLRALAKERIERELIGSITASSHGSRECVMIADKHALGIISAALSTPELSEMGVVVVEALEQKLRSRVPLPAVYVCAPTLEAITMIEEDVEKGKYSEYHLFFTYPAPKGRLGRLGLAKNSSDIKTCGDWNLDFVPWEERTFLLQQSGELVDCFGERDKSGFEHRIERTACSLWTLLQTCGDPNPGIRFSAKSNYALGIARELDSIIQLDRTRPPRGSSGSVVLIVDRTIDLIAPLLHEFTYQAMVGDVMGGDVEDGKLFRYKYETQGGEMQEREALLDETNTFWCDLRHRHVQDVLDVLSENVKALRESKGGQVKLDKEVINRGEGDFKALSALIRDRPDFEAAKAANSLHLHIYEKLMAAFRREHLSDVAIVEQSLATGDTKVTMETLLDILGNPHISKESKQRLIMLYVVTQGGIREDQRRRFMAVAEINFKEQHTIRNLSLLGVDVQVGRKKKKSKSGWFKKKRNRKEDESVAFELSRYVPHMKDVMKECAKQSLSEEDYPPCGELVNLQRVTNAAGPQKFSGVPKWAQHRVEKEKNKKDTDAGRGSSVKKGGPRLYIYVVGGVTMGEIRCVYEMCNSDKYAIDAIVGSSDVLVPSKYLEELSQLSEMQTLDVSVDMDEV